VRARAHGSIDATVRLPARPFDLAAWRALDITALRRATVAVDEITVDDLLARRLGLGTWRGRLGGSVDVAEAMSELHGRIAVRGVTGSVIRRPIDAVVDATLDDAGLRATLDATIDGVAVATGTASAPVDPDRIASEGVAAAMTNVPLTGAVSLVETDVTALLQTFGEQRRIQGKVTGSGTLAGTLAAPEAKATVIVRGLGGQRSRIHELVADGSYAGGKLAAKLTASQEGGGTLLAKASYDPAAPNASELVLQAKRFQISPLARLLPDVVGVRGVVDADLGIVGLDPETARPRGVIKIRDAQIPLIDEIGAITNGKLDLLFATGGAKLIMSGKSEGGDVELAASAVLDGLLPRTMTIDASVRNLTIISTMQPRIAAGLHAEVTLAGDHWKVDARLRDGRIVVPDEEGTALHPASPPADVVFVEKGTIRTPPRAKAKHWFQQRPSDPFVRVALVIEPVEIVSKELRGEVGGHLDIAAGDDGVSIDGQIEARTGEVMVFDRRYLLERALLAFDGPPDPLLDIRMQHDFPSVSMNVGIRGRLSDPELELTSSPSVFTEGQLLGFLLGGSPGSHGGDSTETLASAAASVASQTVGGFLTRRLPVQVDVLRYEPATTSSSAAVTIGKWVSDKLLILARSRLDARPDENRAEAELEYWWTDRTLIDLSGGDRKVFGADLLWTKRR
jgi:translocation and assembly module TamB